MTNRTSAVPPVLVFVAGVLMLAGALARLYDLDRMVVWHDEVFTLIRVLGYERAEAWGVVFGGEDLKPSEVLAIQRPAPGHGWGDTLDALMENPEHGPLYYVAARLAVPLIDSPVVAARAASALLAILLPVAVFWLARELFDDAKPAWIAATLAAVSPLHILYAQEARQYALWTVIAVAASAALLRALRRGRAGDWVPYALLVTLGLYTHLLFTLVMAAHAAYLVFALRGEAGRTAAVLWGWGVSVASACLLFLPWIGVLVGSAERVERVTSWMERAVPLGRILEAWGMSLVRVFVDLPGAGSLLLLGLLPLSWMLWRFCTHAPTRASVFLCLMFLPFAAVVLFPDLVFGGSRSLHPRYVLPAFVAVGVAVAYVLAAGWEAPSQAGRATARAGLFLILGLGIWSDMLILRADTWWSKNFSAHNHRLAEMVNATQRPLIVVTNSGVGLGEAVSLAYALSERAVVRGEPAGGGPGETAAFSDIFLLTPSAEVRTALAPKYELTPVTGSWQWYRAVPRVAPLRDIDDEDAAASSNGAE